MQVPASIHGKYPEVRRRMRRMLTKMKRGASFEESLGADQLIDTAEYDAYILLMPPGRGFAGRQAFHPEIVLAEVLGGVADGIVSPEMEETVFNTCLQSAWGVLLLLAHSLTTWVKPEHRWVPFLQATARFWPVLEAEGPRYVYITSAPKTLEHTLTAVEYVLANAGIFWGGPDLMRPPNWPALVEAYAERRKQELH